MLNGFRAKRIWPRRLIRAAILFFIILGVSFAVWAPLDIDERDNVRRITLLSARSVQADLAAEMQVLTLAQVRLAGLWPGRGKLSMKDLELNSHLFLDHHPGYLALEWVSPSLKVKRIIARQSSYRTDLSRENKLLRPVLQATIKSGLHGGIMSQSFLLPNGRRGNCIVAANPVANTSAGYLVAIIDTQTVLESVLTDHRELGYAVSILEADTELYGADRSSADFQVAWAQDVDLQMPDVQWRVRVWPTPEMLADLRSPLPEIALVLGAVSGLLLIATIYFGRSAEQRSKQLLDAHNELELTVEKRTAELRRTNTNLEAEIIDRKKAEESLSDFSSRLLRMQDEERRRIARELHDSTAQLLAAGSMNIDRAQIRTQNDGDTLLGSILQETRESLGHATVNIRTLSYLLHPPALDELGMEYVLPWYAEGFSKRSGITVELNIRSGLGRLPREVELTLFRVTQEALANAHRQLGSRRARINLSRQGGCVKLEISDNGPDMPQNICEAPEEGSVLLGVGIAGMRERVRQLGGDLEMTRDQTGTTVKVVLVLDNATSATVL